MKIKALLAILFSLIAFGAEADCFIAKENRKVVKQIGKCDTRYSPFSTFKVPIAVMGFDSGFLKNSKEPSLKYTGSGMKELNIKEYPIMMYHSQDQTPATWMRYSAIWYSQAITKYLGMAKFQEYVTKFDYGNQDLSGTGKNEGLINAWLGTSLKISPVEQVVFIEKLSNKELPVSKEAQERTKELIALENIWDDWKLHGKTGGSKVAGWFVGWAEKGDRRIVFAQYVEPKNALISGGQIAKELSKNNLISIMLNK
jgi:beta-lactamase class D